MQKDNISKIDNTLSVSFGMLIFSLMAAIFISSIIYFNHLIHAEQDRLGSVIANSIGDSINRVSFSGKYQARLLVEELKSKNENIRAISIQEPSGLVVAHSSRELNGLILNDPFFEKAKEVMIIKRFKIQDISVQNGAIVEELTEIDIPYKKGYEAETVGVIRVFLSAHAIKSSMSDALIYFSALILVLTALSIFIARRLSLHIGAPVKMLAFKLQGILRYAPLSIYVSDRGLNIVTTSVLYDEISAAVSHEQSRIMRNEAIEKSVFNQSDIVNYDYSLNIGEERRYFHSMKCPISKDEHGKVSLVCTIAVDITDQKVAQEKLFELNKMLETMVEEETQKRLEAEQIALQQSKMAMMGEMIGAIAHQWRQPLNTLGLTIQDIEDAYVHGELDADYIRKTIAMSMSKIQFMSKTIDDFRNFFSPNKTKIDFYINEAVRSTISIMSAQLDNMDIQISYEPDGNTIYFGYESEFQQVLLNLISNAKDAINDGKCTDRRIILRHTSQEEFELVSIEDTGGGVPDEIIDRIFEPYFTTKEQGRGTGIGLFMSKQIVERHMHGFLELENIALGAKFTIKLHRKRIEA